MTGRRLAGGTALVAAWLVALAPVVVPTSAAGAAAAVPQATAARAPAPSGTAPSGLTVGGIAAPADVEGVPQLGWHVATARQSGYRVVVASTRAAAAAGRGDVWDSGRVVGAQQRGVPYAGPALAPSERYFWAVRTWDGAGRPSAWSPAAWFGTGTAWADSQPVWAAPSTAPAWTDYTYAAQVRVDAVALGLTFRATDARNSYMWQLRGADNQLKTHRQVNGTYTALKTVDLPAGTLAIGRTVGVRIEVAGPTIRTWIDDVLVDTTTDATFAQGSVGVRTGMTESGVLDDVRVVAPDGEVLLEDDFSTASSIFACGTVSDGALAVGTGQACLNRGPGEGWAFVRDEVDLAEKEIAWATLYATGTDARASKQYVFKAWVAGHFAGLGPTRPVGDETRYDGYDVTALLDGGGTATLALLGWAASGRQLQAELVVEYADGSRQVAGTGPDWRALDGGAVWAEAGSIGTSYFRAPVEDLDARAYPWGWGRPGFDDAAWPAAVVQDPIGTLVATPTAKVEEKRHDPVRVEARADGDQVVDFGRTWIGGVHWSIDVAPALAGRTVELRFGEVRNPDGSVKWQLNTGNRYRDVVTLRAGQQTIETWGARVFRYVEVVGAPEPVSADSLQALALVYPFDASASTFRSSDRDLVAVQRLAKNSVESLNLNFYTDSWTRERTNYEADAYLQQMSTLYLMDDLSLARYSMDFFRTNRTWPTEWPMYLVLAVRDAWQQTGDLSQAASLYDVLVDKLPTEWIDPETGLVRKTTGSDGCNSRTDCDIVDWPASERDGYVFEPYNTVVNALSYRAFGDMAELARALGRRDDAARYAGLATGVRDGLNGLLYDEATGSYDDGLDASLTPTGHHALHASAFALAFGVPEDAARARVTEAVASRGMACSVYCAAFLVQGLFAGGDGTAGVRMLTDGTGVRSWLHMIEQGAGATMEAWDPSLKPNLTYSHPWAASPAFTVPAGLFGIRPVKPGYATLRIAPQPGDVDWAAVTTPTVRGSVGAGFDHGRDGALRLVASVPGGSRATLALPTGATRPVRVWVDGRPRTVAPAGGWLEVPGVGPGCHLLTSEPRARVGARLTDVCTEPLRLARTTTTASLRVPRQVALGERVTVRVRVRADDGGPVSGRVTLWRDGRPSARWLHDGAVTLRWRVGRAGPHRVGVRYDGRPALARSWARATFRAR